MKTTIALVLLIAAMLSTSAYSSIITVVAEGVFSEYTDPGGYLPFAEPAPGTVFTINFTFDDTTTDELDFLPYIGLYRNPISDMSLMIGDDTFGIGENNSILILDDAESGGGANRSDIWIASTSTATPTGMPNMVVVEGFSLILATVLSSAPVPTLSSANLVAPSKLSNWNLSEIRYTVSLQSQDGTVPQEELALAYAIITNMTVVPLPAAVWLFGSALGLLGWMRSIKA